MATTKQIEAAIIDSLMTMIDRSNYGMCSNRHTKDSSFKILDDEHIKIYRRENIVTKDGEPFYKINNRYATRKVNGMYKELKPVLVPIV